MSITLDQHPLFEGVARDVLDPLLDLARVASFARGALLASPGSLRHELLLVLDGFLHSYELTDDGGRVLFEVVGPGDFDGAVGVLGGVAHFTEAAAPARVAFLPQSGLDRAVARDVRLAANLMAALTRRISSREHQLAAAALRDPSKQIAKQLLALADGLADDDGKAGESAKLRTHVTHQQIADMLGIRRETVTIHLHLLARAGGVSLEPDGLRLYPKRLLAILDDRLSVRRAERAG